MMPSQILMLAVTVVVLSREEALGVGNDDRDLGLERIVLPVVVLEVGPVAVDGRVVDGGIVRGLVGGGLLLLLRHGEGAMLSRDDIEDRGRVGDRARPEIGIDLDPGTEVGLNGPVSPERGS